MATSRTLLKDTYPEIAAQWHPTRNADATDGTKKNLPLTVDNCGITTQVEVWWQCGQGHEWLEKPLARCGMKQWKTRQDDCPICVNGGTWVTFNCGHRSANPKHLPKADSNLHIHNECGRCEWDAAHEERTRKEQDVKALFRDSADEWKQQAATWLHTRLPHGPEGMPAAMYPAWLNWAQPLIAYDLARETVLGDTGTYGNRETVQRWIATPEVCRRAQLDAQPVSPFPYGNGTAQGAAVWAAPALYGGSTPPPLGQAWHRWAQQLLTDLITLGKPVVALGDTTGDTTYSLTETFFDHLTRLTPPVGDPPRHQHVYRELTIPTIPTGATRFGRADLTLLWSDGLPAVHIEIDHVNKATSLEKLRFVADQGGIGIWLRWDKWDQSCVVANITGPDSETGNAEQELR